MANQNVLQLPQQTGSADTTSVLYAVRGGNTDTGLPLTVLFNSPKFTGVPLFNGAATLPVAQGGTGATTAAAARTNLGAASSANNTFTGNQAIATANAFLLINDTSGTGTSRVTLQSDAANVWGLVSQANSTFTLSRYVAGVLTDTPISVSNSTGNVTFSAGATIPTATINGGTSNGMVIGNATQAAGAFTTLIATGLIMPTSTVGIKGTVTNDNAPVGSVGQFVSSTVLVGAAVPLTTGVVTNVTSISLTAGDWDVWGNIVTNPGATTVTQSLAAGIGLVSATFPSAPNGGAHSVLPIVTAAGGLISMTAGQTRISVAATTTVFLVTLPFFTISTNAVYGFLGARRVR